MRSKADYVKYKQRIWNGRNEVRSAVYVAAFIASRNDPEMKAERERMQTAGKPPQTRHHCPCQKTPDTPKRHDERAEKLPIWVTVSAVRGDISRSQRWEAVIANESGALRAHSFVTPKNPTLLNDVFFGNFIRIDYNTL